MSLIDQCCTVLSSVLIKENEFEFIFQLPAQLVEKVLERVPLYRCEIFRAIYYASFSTNYGI